MSRKLAYLRPVAVALIFLGSAAALVYGARQDAPILGELATRDFLAFPFAYRILSMIAAIFLLIAVYYGARQHAGRVWAIGALFLAAASPTLLGMGHYFSPNIFAALFGALAGLILLNGLPSRHYRKLILASFILAVAILIQPANIFLVFGFAGVTVIAALRAFFEIRHQDGSRLWASRRLIAVFLNFVIVLVLTGLFGGLAFIFLREYLGGFGPNFLAASVAGFGARFSLEFLRNFVITEPFANILMLGLAVFYVVGVSTRTFIKRVLRRGEPLSGLVALYYPEIALAVILVTAVALNTPQSLFLPLFFIFITLVLKNWFTVPWFRAARNAPAKLAVIYRERFRIGGRLLILVLIFVWWGFSAVAAFPNFLADDRGQDLYRLRAWLNLQNISAIALDYYGPADAMRFLGGRAIPWWSELGNPHNDGVMWLAVSRKKLTPLPDHPLDQYQWLKNKFSPDEIIGATIYVYDLTER